MKSLTLVAVLLILNLNVLAKDKSRITIQVVDTITSARQYPRAS